MYSSPSSRFFSHPAEYLERPQETIPRQQQPLPYSTQQFYSTQQQSRGRWEPRLSYDTYHQAWQQQQQQQPPQQQQWSQQQQYHRQQQQQQQPPQQQHFQQQHQYQHQYQHQHQHQHQYQHQQSWDHQQQWQQRQEEQRRQQQWQMQQRQQQQLWQQQQHQQQQQQQRQQQQQQQRQQQQQQKEQQRRQQEQKEQQQLQYQIQQERKSLSKQQQPRKQQPTQESRVPLQKKQQQDKILLQHQHSKELRREKTQKYEYYERRRWEEEAKARANIVATSAIRLESSGSRSKKLSSSSKNQCQQESSDEPKWAIPTCESPAYASDCSDDDDDDDDDDEYDAYNANDERETKSRHENTDDRYLRGIVTKQPRAPTPPRARPYVRPPTPPRASTPPRGYQRPSSPHRRPSSESLPSPQLRPRAPTPPQLRPRAPTPPRQRLGSKEFRYEEDLGPQRRHSMNASYLREQFQQSPRRASAGSFNDSTKVSSSASTRRLRWRDHMLEDVALFSKTDPPNKVKTLVEKKARSPSHSGKEGLVDRDAQSSDHVGDLKTNRGVGIMSGGSSEKAGGGAVGDIVPSQQLNLSALSGASTAQLAQNLVPILRTGKLTSDAKKLWANVSVSRLLGLRKRGDPNHRGRFKANTIVGKNTINNSGHWRTVEVTNMLWMHHTGYMDSHRPASLPSWPKY